MKNFLTKFKFKVPGEAKNSIYQDGVPIKTSRASTTAAVLSIGSNLFLAWLFLRALLRPLANIDFIVQTGIWLFIVEFLSIFVSIGKGERTSMRLGFTGFFVGTVGFLMISAFAIVFGWLFLGNIYLPIIFLSSTLAKIFSQQATHERSEVLAFSIPLLLGSLFIVFFIFGPEFWVKLFPFPENFDQYTPVDWAEKTRHGDISGEFVERPQTMLVWGIIYYLFAAAIEFFFFMKRRKNARMVKIPF